MSEEFYQGIGNAVDDVRSKFEESVWGRPVTEQSEPAWPQAQELEQSFGGVTRKVEVNAAEWPQAEMSQMQNIEREQNRDVDIDR